MAVAIVLLLSAAVWVGVRAVLAKNDLEGARADLASLSSQAGSFDSDEIRATVDRAAERAANARSLTSDPIWRAFEAVPVLGINLTAVREIGEIVDDAVSDVVVPLAETVAAFDPASFSAKDGAVDLGPIVAAIEPVRRASDSMQGLLGRARDVPTDGTVDLVARASEEIEAMLEQYATPLATVGDLLPFIPSALGADGPRQYVLMFENPAEPRALGGSALSFSLVTVDNGRISLASTDAASTGAFRYYEESVIPIPDGAEAVYPNGEFGRYIAEATIRPSFTTAAQIVREIWSREFGSNIDGVLSIDPVALSYVLRATGPIDVGNGDVIDAENLVPLLLNGVYLRYAGYDPGAANLLHDALYAQTAAAVFTRLTTGDVDIAALLGALSQGWSERRVLFWSADDNEQAQLAQFGLNGELPVTDDLTVRAGLYFQDSVGSKLGFYLRQSLQVSHGFCAGEPDPTYRVQAELTNVIDGVQALTMPFHITGEWRREGLFPGLNRMTLRLYAPPGATIKSASIDGAPVSLEPMHDSGYPVGKMLVAVPPGVTVAVSYEFTLPGSADRQFEAQVTPLVTATETSTVPFNCGE